MENKEMIMNELNVNEMEEAAGGRGGSRRMLPDKAHYVVYRIQKGDTLIRIANRFGTTADYLKKINPTIKDKNDITAGFYIYVPA